METDLRFNTFIRSVGAKGISMIKKWTSSIVEGLIIEVASLASCISPSRNSASPTAHHPRFAQYVFSNEGTQNERRARFARSEIFLYRSTILSRSFHESGVLAPLDRDPFSRSRLTLYEQRFFFFIFIKFHKQIWKNSGTLIEVSIICDIYYLKSY